MLIYGIDIYYLIFILPALIITIIAQAKVSTTFSKYSKLPSSRRMTGAEVARRILDANGLYHIVIERVGGNLSDHYDPTKKILRLSDPVYSSTSVAALGVAAHECGHAIQHATGYVPLKLRHVIYPLVNFSSMLAIPVIILGFILETSGFVLVGIILFSAVVLFQLITLPVEFNASSRALVILENDDYLYGDEVKGAKKVLSAAAMTYVASALVSLMQLLRFIMIFNNRRD